METREACDMCRQTWTRKVWKETQGDEWTCWWLVHWHWDVLSPHYTAWRQGRYAGKERKKNGISKQRSVTTGSAVPGGCLVAWLLGDSANKTTCGELFLLFLLPWYCRSTGGPSALVTAAGPGLTKAWLTPKYIAPEDYRSPPVSLGNITRNLVTLWFPCPKY